MNMPYLSASRLRQAVVGLAATGSLCLSGCNLSSINPGVSSFDQAVKVSGVVHGGQSPIQGAIITLYHTDPTATTYGAPGIVVGTATTLADGTFIITTPATAVTCPAGTMAYITSAGGYPVGQPTLANTNSLEMSALGDCANVSAATFVVISEVTTTAAAYALSGFTTTSLNNGTGLYQANVSAPAANSANNANITPTRAAGLLHAFTNAATLVSSSDGRPQQTASINVNGVAVPGAIPYAEINTLGNIMQACVDSQSAPGALSTTCSQLFTQTPSITGVVPANTLQSFINLARNPYPSTAAMNASTGLLSLAKGVSGAFLPQLTAPPYDWTLSIVWRGTTTIPTATVAAGSTPAPYWVGIDAQDTVYYGASVLIAANEGPAIYPFNPYGINTPTFGTAGSSTTIRGIAADTLGNIWANNNGFNIYQFTNGGTPTQYTSTVGSTTGIAVDSSNNIWVAHAATTPFNVEQLAYNTSTKTWATNYTATTPGGNYGVSVDHSQNIWAAGYIGGDLTMAAMVPNTGTAAAPVYAASGTPATTLTPITTAYGSSLSKAYNAVFDASGNAWYTIYGGATVTTAGLDEVTPNALLGATSLSAAPAVLGSTVGSTAQGNTLGTQQAEFAAIDGAGTIFIADNASDGIHAYTTQANAVSQVLSPTAGFRSCLLLTTATATCPTSQSAGSIYNPRQVVIDSTGSVWGGITTGGITQVIGVAAPVYPLLSVGLPGVEPGFTTAAPLP